MIKNLQIKNYALIEALEIDFSKGLTIITGETGAGKSILLGALGLIMGKRADTKVLYFEDKKCVVEAQFDIRKYDLKTFFDTEDIDYDAELVIRREITPSGKSRAFVNDTPVNLKILQKLSSALIDLHQQFDTQDIHNVSFQLRLLDALAANKPLLTTYQHIFQKYRKDKRKLEELSEQNKAANQEIEFLNFQLQEFDEVELVEGEQEKLEMERDRLTNAEEIKRSLGNAFQFLSEAEHSIIGQLESVSLSLGQIKKFDPKISQLLEKYQGLIFELEEVAQEFGEISEEIEYDGERILEIQDRLDLIYRLQNKHGVNSIADLLAIQDNLQSRLNTFSDVSAEIDTLKKALKIHQEELQQIAVALREKRQSVVPLFQKDVLNLLGQMAMENARLEIEFNPLQEFSSTGLDEVNYLFAANKGGRLLSIKEVASGGELSRLTLATKSLVASSIPLPTLIFDEIDTGIGGDVALRMGKILRALSNEHQVILITHSPQIASKADVHYFVYKKDTADRTITKVRKLNEAEQLRAIATMLSQNPPSESALENARELLNIS